MGVDGRPMAVISGTANRPLAEKIVSELGMDLLPVEIYHFKDGETGIRIKESSGDTRFFSYSPRLRL